MADSILDTTSGPVELRRSPLAATAAGVAEAGAGGGGVRLAERPFTTMVGLRVVPGSTAADAIGAVLGAPLPAGVGEVTGEGDHRTLWLGPDEWLVVSDGSREELLSRLRAAAEGPGVAIVDVSANRTVLELEGPAARSVLDKGCPADLHPRAFGAGRAITTTLARVPVLLWQTGEQTYRLLPRSSYAEYVAAWLLDAAQEFLEPVG
ncbi:sarcosine oxidase subunit gamma [Nocardioides flavescens]|uniref:Sarcosine oxidase subunit gamma family protein n=1 Tax=Nocardioides flavescens TaxID=2691959 RepID=A0A6L7F1X0_9ACTN|nr:sarcosine oxidase subunit gamma family protein [Nocardioides flavescens]MXG91021.1 sarcosine oxidase subunit gamma family protein [Nocardioides flavescens]